MHFIRFLKAPTTTTTAPSPAKHHRSKSSASPSSGTVTISTLITISTDLSESFFQGNVSLRATLRANTASRQLLASKIVSWTSGARNLSISLAYTPSIQDAPSSGILCVSATENRADDMRTLFAQSAEPRILSAWSPPFDILVNGAKADALIERKLQLSAGKMVRIWEEAKEDIARHIWPGGLAITAYFSTLPSPPTGVLEALAPLLAKPSFQILELGAGCGLAGIALHTLFPTSTVTLTDLPITTEITARNLSLLPTPSDEPAPGRSEGADNGRISYAPLDWAQSLPEWCASTVYDLIVVADCTYNTASIPHLVGVLVQLCEASPDALVLLAHKVRHDSEEMFFQLANERGLVKREQRVFEMAGDTVDLYVIGKR